MEEHMITKYLATALVTTALMTGVASAQTATTKTTTADNTASMHREGEWRASKLVGVDVYNDANEKVGDINEVILDKSGKVANVILGVGGFLGMGEHYVAVGFDKLKWVNEPVRSTTVSTTTNPTVAPATNVDSNARTAADGNVRTTGAATTTRPVRAANEHWYPDHVVINATKDQLKTMPQFKF
jgi:sporulation protein YlmC with PRC-barrel domain